MSASPETIPVRRVLLALYPTGVRSWVGAVVLGSGEVKLVRLGPAVMGRFSPPSLVPVLALVQGGLGPLEVLLVLPEGDDEDTEFLAIQIQHDHLHSVRITGVTAVNPRALLVSLGLSPELDPAGESVRGQFVVAVNAAVESEFTPDQYYEAYAVAMVLAGSAGPWSLPAIFRYLPPRRVHAPAATPAHAVPGAGVSVDDVSSTSDHLCRPSGERLPSTVVAEVGEDSDATPAQRGTGVECPRSPSAGQPSTATAPTCAAEAPPGRCSRRPHPQPERPFLTLREVSQTLGIDRSTVYRLISRGDIASHRVGRQIRVLRLDLEAFLSTRRSGTTEERALRTRGKITSLRPPKILEDEEGRLLRRARETGLIRE